MTNNVICVIHVVGGVGMPKSLNDRQYIYIYLYILNVVTNLK